MGALSDAALTAAIKAVLAASPFHGEGHRKVWARLRHRGIRTSLRRVLRLMRHNSLLAPARTGPARGPRTHDGAIIPDTVDYELVPIDGQIVRLAGVVDQNGYPQPANMPALGMIEEILEQQVKL